MCGIVLDDFYLLVSRGNFISTLCSKNIVNYHKFICVYYFETGTKQPEIISCFCFSFLVSNCVLLVSFIFLCFHCTFCFLRNVSSDGEYARKKLRECEGLVESVITIIRSAMMCNDMDNKSVENCVCLLRNLSYACQEIIDPDYLKKRSVTQTKNQGIYMLQ